MYGEITRGITRLVKRLEVFINSPLYAVSPQGQTLSTMWVVDAFIIIFALLMLCYLMHSGYKKINRIPGVHSIALVGALFHSGFFVFTFCNRKTTQFPRAKETSLPSLYAVDINDVALRNAHQNVNITEAGLIYINKWSFVFLLSSLVLFKCSSLDPPTSTYPVVAVLISGLIAFSYNEDDLTEIVRWLAIIVTAIFCYWSTPWKKGERLWAGPRQNSTITSINPWTGSESGLRNRASEWLSSLLLTVYLFLKLKEFPVPVSILSSKPPSMYAVPVGIARQFGRSYESQPQEELYTARDWVSLVFVSGLFLRFATWTVWYWVHICSNRLILEPKVYDDGDNKNEAIVSIPDPRSGERVGLRFVRPLYERSGMDQICMLGSKPGGGTISRYQERIVTHINNAAVNDPQQAVSLVRSHISNHYDQPEESEDSADPDPSEPSELQLTFRLQQHLPVYHHLGRTRSLFGWLFNEDGGHNYDTGRTLTNIWEAFTY
eukprot:TRINITY_DN12144_c0_g1_i3.p1 TRINITY_DN12144_c0_g1~~TRINITY_DN12144_c0_g1_i3.p1  ORF type:complete len:514 (+),score=36.18 TRINITY_DN12144_c0_g1_i3:70-1542(+)